MILGCVQIYTLQVTAATKPLSRTEAGVPRIRAETFAREVLVMKRLYQDTPGRILAHIEKTCRGNDETGTCACSIDAATV